MSEILSMEEVTDKFRQNRDLIDMAYSDYINRYLAYNNRQYGFDEGRRKTKEGAHDAIKTIFFDYTPGTAGAFTNDNNNIRYRLDSLCSSGFYQIQQILLDYAISSFFLNHMSVVSNEEMNGYANNNENLDYSSEHATQVMATAVAVSPLYATTMLSINKKIKNALVEAFIKERYDMKRAEQLDGINTSMVGINLGSAGKNLTLSHSVLNMNMYNFMRQADEEFCDNKTISYEASGYGGR